MNHRDEFIHEWRTKIRMDLASLVCCLPLAYVAATATNPVAVSVATVVGGACMGNGLVGLIIAWLARRKIRQLPASD